MILAAVELKDLTMLAPLSVKDAIWLDCATALKRKEDITFENDKVKFIGEQFESLGELLMDVRHVAMHTDSFVQLSALKESKHAKINPIQHKDLPSHYLDEAKRKRLEAEGRSRKNNGTASDGGKKKKKYATYKEYLEAEENDKEEQDKLYRRTVAFVEHVRQVEARQGGFESSRGAKILASEEERLAKIRAEREAKEKGENPAPQP